jgi:hypothetical protein
MHFGDGIGQTIAEIQLRRMSPPRPKRVSAAVAASKCLWSNAMTETVRRCRKASMKTRYRSGIRVARTDTVSSSVGAPIQRRLGRDQQVERLCFVLLQSDGDEG